ncbi:MAG TPA: tetratricopeptide repeat protein [Tenuifilaceae bacterium]|nr:tetratricopeptide repeat protein [Tenuifilaceae bacterium]HPE17069.1 tetratricopeptide repeat protein [Tenuifilaceae bacterium]HPJ44797.1 tetratricopeptide repeat protein [Tenuifilaceae bacterium]HPQ32909.1 tetratricopeptide repeat protein [Tenuifilaceae bacterium]HRX66727.1 tetratricopeptide repeat protein [Tenuifilaceae bacterium]
MQKLCTLILVLLFLFSGKLATGQNPPELDSLLKSEQAATNDSVKFATLSKIALAYADSSYEKSLTYWRKALELATKKRYRLGMADCYQQIGYILMRQGEFPTALQELNNALTIFEFIKNRKGMGEVYNDIGLIYKSWGRYEQALQNYLSSLAIYDEIGDDEGSSIASNNIGQIYYFREEYEKAITFFQQYLHVNRRNNYARAVAGAANNIASAYLELEQYDKALDYYTESLQIYDSLGIDLGVAILQDNIGSLYSKKQQYTDALLFHKNALNIFQSINSKPRIGPVLMNIGLVYTQTKSYPLALNFLLQSKNIAEELNQRENLKDIYFNLSEVYDFLGEHKKALVFHKMYVNLKDSLMNDETAEKLVSMEARYETEKKSRELQLLQSKLDQQKKVQILTLIIVVLFVFQTLILIRENHQKRRAIQRIKCEKDSFNRFTSCFYENYFQNIKRIPCHFNKTVILPEKAKDFSSTILYTHPKDESLIVLMVHSNSLKSEDKNIVPEAFQHAYHAVNSANNFDAKKLYSLFKNTYYQNIIEPKNHLQLNCIILSSSQITYYGDQPFWYRKSESIVNKVERKTLSSEPTLLSTNDFDEVFFTISSPNALGQGFDQPLSKTLEILNNEPFGNVIELIRSSYDFWETSAEENCEAIVFALRI